MSRPDESGHDGPVEGMESLYADRRAPGGLEDRVVERLRADGWPAASEGRPRGRATWAPRLVAAVVVFVAGWGVGRFASTPEPMPFAVEQGQASGTGSAGVGPTHVLLLWENEDRDPAVPDATLAAEYGAWMRAVGAGGTSITGQELGPGRVYLSPGGGALTAPVPDEAAPGPPLADRRLGGYFLITAADLPAAAAVAGGHPHLTYGGSIEVAEILRR